MKTDRAITLGWLDLAKDLDPGESILIPCDSRERQKGLVAEFRKEIKILAAINPLVGSTLSVQTATRSGKIFVKVQNLGYDPKVALKESADGEFTRVELPELKIRQDRIRKLMKEDGL
jgi:hypothetical protein